ncbi:hypothetical protein NC651_017088 [Populus alba x Populus x berolinensis]|nr:hypothetical protein NC651_017088 [Populus alba x Populus x berolinensis]
MLKNSNSAIIIFFFSLISMSQHRINLFLLLHSFKLSSPSNANNKSNSNETVTSNYNPSRRLALFQLGTDIPQSQFLSGNLAPARSIEVAEQDVLEWVENDKRRTHASWCL